MDYLARALAIKGQLIDWRRDFHRNPELGFEEYRTSEVIKGFLKGEGIEFYEVAGTGICATIKGDTSQKNTKTVALRADIDALPLIDKKNREYSSKIQGKMHACGHDAHMAILLGVAKILNETKKSINGTV
jgi:amidohydrolase